MSNGTATTGTIPSTPEHIEPLDPSEEVVEEEINDIYADPSTGKPAEEPVKTEPEPVAQAPTTEEPPEWVDPVFKATGKSISEVIAEQAKAYSQARKEMSRAQAEANESRRLVDEYILSNLQKPTQDTSQQIKTVFEELGEKLGELGVTSNISKDRITQDILRIIAPVVLPLYDKLGGLETGVKEIKTETELGKEHFEVVNTKEFADWALANYSQRMLKEANDDPQEAKFMVERYKASRVQPPPVVPQNTTVKPIAPSIPAHTVKATEPVAEKVYSRRELISLQNKDPERYRQMSDEILRAYKEGRVK